MARVCKYPDKDCKNYFISYTKNKKFCRLSEWKKRMGTCPYDKSITASGCRHKRVSKEQTRLSE